MGNRRAIAVYLAGSFLWSWGLLAAYAAQGGTSSSKTFFLVLLPYLLGPGVSALATQHLIVRKPIPAGVGLTLERSTWIVASWFTAPIIALAVLALSSVWPGQHVSFEPLELLARDAAMIPAEQLEVARTNAKEASPAVVFFSQFSGAMLFGTLLLGFMALWQELGWRGFLLKQLAPFGFWRVSLLTGVLSALWYAPLAAFSGVYKEHVLLGTLAMSAFALLLSPLACWLRLRAGSVVAAAVFVGGLHSFSRLVYFFTVGGDDLTRGLFTLPGLVVLAVACVALAARKAPGADEALKRLADPAV